MNTIPNLEARQQQALQKVAETHPAEKLLTLTLLEAAEYLRDTGRWETARQLADTALTVALRWHYFTYCGKGGMTNKSNVGIVAALRAAGVIDRKTFDKFSAYIVQPNDKRGLFNTLQVVRLIASAMIEPAEDNGRKLSQSEAHGIYSARVNAEWHFKATRAARVEGEPGGIMLLRKAAI